MASGHGAEPQDGFPVRAKGASLLDQIKPICSKFVMQTSIIKLRILIRHSFDET